MINSAKIKNIIDANKNMNFAARANALEQFLRGRMDCRNANVIARHIVARNEGK